MIFKNLKDEYSLFIRLLITIGVSVASISIFYPILKYIEETDNVKIDSVIIIAERGLDGLVLRWNKHDGLYQVGTTRGYA